MPQFTVSYHDTDGHKQHKTLKADTEAGALSWLLSEHGETIAEDSPLAVWRGERPKFLLFEPCEAAVDLPQVEVAS